MTQENGRPVAVIGLGNMGFGTAESLLRAGIKVHGCDLNAGLLEKIADKGAVPFDNAADAVENCRACFLFVINDAQAEAVLFNDDGVVGRMDKGAIVVNCVTVPPDYAVDAAGRVSEAGLGYVDAPVSGGPVGASSGQMTIMASGANESIDALADCFDAIAKTVYRMSETPGDGSRMKMVNQLLAGVHIVAACEALTLAIKSGLEPSAVYEVISNSAGGSWMWNNRMPHVLENDYSPKSAVEIFVKDLGIVLETGKQMRFPLPISAAAHQMFLAAAGAGLGLDDDASVAKIYAGNSGTTLPGEEKAGKAD